MVPILTMLLPAMLVFTPLLGGAQIVWEEALVEVANFPSAPTQEDIYRLATYAGNEAGLPESIELKEKAWEKLKALPDFPECVVREMRLERERAKGGPVSFSGSEYSIARHKALQLMERLPDPRVVRLLGELLSDTEVPEIHDGGYLGKPEAPNALLAARALGRMIENPPLEKYWEDYQTGDLAAWEQWYERAKKDKRSFRFKGHKQDYTLDGPVSVTLAGEQRPSKRDSGPITKDEAGTGQEAEGAPGSKAPVIALGLAALTAAGYWGISRRGRTGQPG